MKAGSGSKGRTMKAGGGGKGKAKAGKGMTKAGKGIMKASKGIMKAGGGGKGRMMKVGGRGAMKALGKSSKALGKIGQNLPSAPSQPPPQSQPQYVFSIFYPTRLI